MKQITMTEELSRLIKERVGQDVETGGLAVFESISLNTRPLPGKNGTIHENAVITSVTLQQMADHINNGGHLPLISDHQLMGEPKGRVFSAKVLYGSRGDLELRTLFYLDPTEARLIQKLNAGSLDEVSVSFMPTEFRCSACGWDYFSPNSSFDNLLDRTCANGHVIGTDGVHAELIGLSDFIEVSLVARGAADEPKIVGQSDSRLAPATALRLVARGFDQNSLLVQATRGVSPVADFDTNALITELSTSKAGVITLTAQLEATNIELASTKTQLETSQAALAAAIEANLNAEVKPNETEAAVSFLRLQLSHLKVAKGEAEPALDSLPNTVAELEAAIRGITADLTAILPVGGVALSNNETPSNQSARTSSAFRIHTKA